MNHRFIYPLWILASALMLTGASFTHATTAERQTIPLYDGAIPGSVASEDLEKVRDPSHPDTFLQRVTYPTLTLFLPAKDKATGTGVVILPGGGYRGVSVVKEGYQVAERFNEQGIAAFVVKYRDPLDANMADKKVGPLQDAQQALVLVRNKAAEWGIDPAKVGIMGFSAGGHLASSVAVHFNDPVLSDWTAAQVRPDFQILVYPVISFDDSIAHTGSRTNLLGEPAEPQWQAYFSNETQVTAQTPPAFLIHASDDTAVVVENSLRYYEALRAKDVSAGMVILPSGGHGFGMRNPMDWFAVMSEWLAVEGF
ncbi:alpha/beta hydrolase [Gilvimarinus algae]|uniref:Alpha/beta hydrolase n=1 Tax=Gilvimarinus algae TaxID=3058037 RepID=A0ABT8TGK3_9GAMM|nr:alpha/beta hydrolase [Gilvimarinus sp. SDUM040014]MDO3383130.1 alpha/beta hydrolase [Gilvimarinus sp. SDUM040014]